MATYMIGSINQSITEKFASVFFLLNGSSTIFLKCKNGSETA